MEIQLNADTAWKLIEDTEEFSILLYAKKNNMKDVKEIKVRAIKIDSSKLQHLSTHKKLENALMKANIMIAGFKSVIEEDGKVVFYGDAISFWRNPTKKRRTSINR
jgi:hypothetical protein